MVRHFVRLKLRLLANRLRTQSVIGTIGYFAIWAGGVIGGVLGGLGVYGLGRLTDEPGMVLILAYTAVFLGWMIIPASLTALDETLDPRRFELLPISPRRLTAGLLAAGAVAPGAVGTLIGLAIATYASFPVWSLAPLILTAVIVELTLCLVIARLVTTFLSNMLASRRARELATLLFGVTIGLVALIPALFGGGGEGSGPDIEVTITSFSWVERLVWLPSGALAEAVRLGSVGEPLAGFGMVSYGIVATLVIGGAWARSVRTMLMRAPTGGRRARKRDDRNRVLALVPTWLRMPSGPILGVAAKELRYLVRDTRVRAQLIGSVVPVVVISLVSRESLSDSPYTPFLAAGFAFLIVLGILSNQFGVDGGSFWAYVVSSAPLSSVVRGKNLGWGLVAVPPIVIAATLLAASSGDFSFVAAAVLGSAGVLLVATAIGNVTSIYGAYPIPESSPFGTRGASGSAFFAVLVAMMASGVLLLPLVGLIGLPSAFMGPVAATAGAFLGLGYGALIYWAGMKVASRLLVERQDLLLETIDGDSG